MAKDKAKADKSKDKSKDKDDAKAEKAAEREFKFGVEDIAEKLDIKPASVRVQLRNKGIEKAGKSYGWNSKAELQEVIDQLKSKDEEDEKPAAKGKKAPAKEEPKAKGKGAKDKASKKKAKNEEDDD